MNSLNIEARPIQNFPGYWVTPIGTVISTRSRWKEKAPRTMGKYSNGKSKHLFVRLHKHGKAHKAYIHHLVAEQFIGKRPSPKHEIRHLDGDPTNNCVDNLAWGTRKENVADAYRHGTAFNKGREIDAKLRPHQVALIKTRLSSGEVVESIANEFNVSKWAIYDIKQGRTWPEIGTP